MIAGMHVPSQSDDVSLLAAGSAAELRSEFDQSFALPAQFSSGNTRDFVLVEAGGQIFAFAATDLHSIEQIAAPQSSLRRNLAASRPGDHLLPSGSATDAHPDSARSDLPWTQVPSSQSALLGIRAFAGQILPVFSLSGLLSRVSSPVNGVPGFCALALAGDDLVGLFFDALVRLVRAEPEQILASTVIAESWQAASLQCDGLVYPVVRVSALLAALALPPAQRDAPNQSIPAREDKPL